MLYHSPMYLFLEFYQHFVHLPRDLPGKKFSTVPPVDGYLHWVCFMKMAVWVASVLMEPVYEETSHTGIPHGVHFL